MIQELSFAVYQIYRNFLILTYNYFQYVYTPSSNYSQNSNSLILNFAISILEFVRNFVCGGLGSPYEDLLMWQRRFRRGRSWSPDYHAFYPSIFCRQFWILAWGRGLISLSMDKPENPIALLIIFDILRVTSNYPKLNCCALRWIELVKSLTQSPQPIQVMVLLVFEYFFREIRLILWFIRQWHLDSL